MFKMRMVPCWGGGGEAHSPEIFYEVTSPNSLVKTPKLLSSATLLEKQIFMSQLFGTGSAKPIFIFLKLLIPTAVMFILQ